jgi:hypothetical protein
MLNTALTLGRRRRIPGTLGWRASATVVAAACLGLTACSSGPLVGAGRLASGTPNFAHTVEKLPSGRNRLVVTVAAGPGQSQDFVNQQAVGFAYEYARTSCPKGYDFFADAPLETKGSIASRYQRTYIFQCR